MLRRILLRSGKRLLTTPAPSLIKLTPRIAPSSSFCTAVALNLNPPRKQSRGRATLTKQPKTRYFSSIPPRRGNSESENDFFPDMKEPSDAMLRLILNGLSLVGTFIMLRWLYENIPQPVTNPVIIFSGTDDQEKINHVIKAIQFYEPNCQPIVVYHSPSELSSAMKTMREQNEGYKINLQLILVSSSGEPNYFTINNQDRLKSTEEQFIELIRKNLQPTLSESVRGSKGAKENVISHTNILQLVETELDNNHSVEILQLTNRFDMDARNMRYLSLIACYSFGCSGEKVDPNEWWPIGNTKELDFNLLLSNPISFEKEGRYFSLIEKIFFSAAMKLSEKNQPNLIPHPSITECTPFSMKRSWSQLGRTFTTRERDFIKKTLCHTGIQEDEVDNILDENKAANVPANIPVERRGLAGIVSLLASIAPRIENTFITLDDPIEPILTHAIGFRR